MCTDIWLQVISLCLAAIAILVSCWISTREMKNANRQSLEQSRNAFFAEYTRRYQDIILAMPDEVFLGTAKLEGKTLKYLQLYFDLCSEEYHLYQQGVIPDDVWKNWFEGMKLTTKQNMYSKGWKIIGGIYNDDFARFISHEVLLNDNRL